MINRLMRWLSGLSLRYKAVYTLLVLILLVILPEVIAPFFEWGILPEVLLNWFNNNSSVLLRLLTLVAALFFLYGIYLHDKLFPFFRKLTFNELKHHRFVIILLIGIFESFLIFFFWDNLKDNINEIGGKNPSWLGPLFTMVAAAPIALFIWTFRNEDKRKELQHIEENIRQADFHKIEEWATTFTVVKAQQTELINTANTADPEATANEAKTQTDTDEDNSIKPQTDETKASALQVAAIYQLLPYLKGEYGDRFVRPTMEIYRSLLSSWQWDEKEQCLAKDTKSHKIIKPAYIAALHILFRQEAIFFRSFDTLSVSKKSNWAPLNRIDLKGADLSNLPLNEVILEGAILEGVILKGANLIWASLKRANLKRANLIGASLIETNLEGANLKGANLKKANLIGANLIGTNLEGANLKGANLKGANLEGANLFGTNLEGANLLGANLKGANLTGANLSEAIYNKKDIEGSIMNENTILRDGSRCKKPESDSDKESD